MEKGMFITTCPSPDGVIHKQIGHVLIDKKRHSNILDARSFEVSGIGHPKGENFIK
jgi:hypothetical protein